MILSLFCTLGNSWYCLLSRAETYQSNHLTLPLLHVSTPTNAVFYENTIIAS